jgi:hypothetical protein
LFQGIYRGLDCFRIIFEIEDASGQNEDRISIIHLVQAVITGFIQEHYFHFCPSLIKRLHIIAAGQPVIPQDAYPAKPNAILLRSIAFALSFAGIGPPKSNPVNI